MSSKDCFINYEVKPLPYSMEKRLNPSILSIEMAEVLNLPRKVILFSLLFFYDCYFYKQEKRCEMYEIIHNGAIVTKRSEQ